jgi:hypothetical protein
MITPVEAAVLARVSTRPIYGWIEADKLHFTETPDGLLHVCLMHFPPTPRSDSDPLRFTQKG